MKKNLFPVKTLISSTRRTISILMCALFVSTLLAVPVGAASDFPGSLGAPGNAAVGTSADNGTITSFSLGFSVPSNVASVADRWDVWSDGKDVEEMNVYLEYDFKYNENGSWHYTSDWEKPDGALDEYKLSDLGETEVAYIDPAKLEGVSSKESMLKSNTVYFRCRFAVVYTDNSLGTDVKTVSPWSNTAAIGKNAKAADVKMDVPALTKAELKTDSTGAPYFEITNKASDSIKTLDNGDGSISIAIEYRKDGGNWVAISGYSRLENEFDVKPENSGKSDTIDIKAGTYEIRARYGYGPVYGKVDVWSGYSNVIKIGTPSFYKGASGWAVTELDRAAGYGLITDRIKDNMKGNITREEFAEIAVKLYELHTGKKAEAGSAAFSDTKNVEIFKAANLGLVEGVGGGKYAPKQLVTREQMAAIVFRAMKVLEPDEDFNSDGAAKFSDDARISQYARNAVYYCSKNSVLQGMGNGSFNPKGNSTREAAVIVCMRAYEFFNK